MTIIVGALWPWWGEAGMPTAPVRGLKPQVAILASDSRWTISREGKADTYEDVGQKMFQIAPDAGAVYAGDVEAGEEALNELVDVRHEGTAGAQGHPFLVARDVFKAVYGVTNTRQRNRSEFSSATATPEASPDSPILGARTVSSLGQCKA